MVVTEEVQRQVAVAVVIAVEEATFLVPVQPIVSDVQVQDDLLRWRLVAAQEHIDKQAGNRRFVPADLLVAVADRRDGSLESVERALAGQRFATVTLATSPATFHIWLLTQRGQQWIFA